MFHVRSPTWLMLVVLIISGLSVINLTGYSEDAVTNLYVTSDSALGSSTFVRSGNGTGSNPYLISDWNMGTRYIRLDNTEAHVLFLNITFTSSSSWAFSFNNARNILVQNVNATGRGRFLSSSSCSGIIMDDCNVTSIPTQANVVDIRNGVDFIISNSRFVHASGQTASITFNNQGNSQRFIDNYLEGIPFNDALFGTDGYIKNCTFMDSPLTLTNGASGARIINNHFDSPGKRALTLITSYFMTVQNNYFHGSDGIYFQTMTYQWVNQYGDIENNTFEGCLRGIGTNSDWSVRPSKYKVHHNYFGNCSDHAIDWGIGMANRIWNNVFYHNAGTDNDTSGSQCEQYNWAQQLYKNIWTMGSIGNFWANHRTPDADRDGIVDEPYTINSGGTDTRPSTNPYFDTTPPTIRVTSPTDLYPDRSYLVISYIADDVGSGIGSIEMRVGSGPWMDVTNFTSRSVFLKQGSHFIHFRVTDRGGLDNSTTVQYIIDQTEEVIDLKSPLDKQHLSNSEVDIRWELADYFTPTNQTITIDGGQIYLGSGQRLYRPTLTEGSHIVSLRVSDEMGISVSREVNFTVDLTDPIVEIYSPQSGSTLSNTFVRLNYNISDNLGLASLDLNIDGSGWISRPLQETSFSTLLDDGPHTVEVRGVDRSGRETSQNISFSIGDTPLLKFLQPAFRSSTRDSQVHLIWEYLGPFNWNRSLLRVGRSGDFDDLFGQTSLNITLDDDGEYEIVLRLMDIFGNYIEAVTEVIKDTKDPFVGFLTPTQGEILGNSSVLIQWGGRDNDDLPLDHYLLKVNDGPWMDMGIDTSTLLMLEEGDHTVLVKAVDLAGNTGQEGVSFTLDLTLPEVEFISPMDGAIATDSFIEFSFYASDNLALSALNLSIDGRINISVYGKTSYLTTVGTDGEHFASLIAIDTAGNVAVTTIRITVDTKDPLIEWIDAPEGVSSNSTLAISWSIIEDHGLSEISIVLDGVKTILSIDVRSYTFDLQEGIHWISLKATDKAGLSSELITNDGIMIDLTVPTLQIDEIRTTVELNNLLLFWFSADDGSGIDDTFVSLDGGDPETVLSNSTFTFEGLSVGDHFIILTVYDNAGNPFKLNWSFSVDIGEVIDDQDENGYDPFLLIIGAVVAFLIFSVLVIIIVLRKKRKEDKKIEASRRERMKRQNKVKLNIPMAPVAQALPPEASLIGQPQPVITGQKVEETEIGSGYIRPDKKKKPKRKGSKDIQNVPTPEKKHSIAQEPTIDETETSTPEVDLSDISRPAEVMDSPVWDDENDHPSHEMDHLKTEPGRKKIRKIVDDVSWDDDDDEVTEFEGLEDVDEFEELEDIEEFEDLEDVEEFDDHDDDGIEEWG